MPDANVSSCILNILDSFISSLGLYKRLKQQRRRLHRSKKSDKIQSSEDEQRLTRSLRQGPEHISVEYRKNLGSVGDRFAIGDAIAQTSLAEVLLRLNVGLVGIITCFLDNSHRKRAVPLDYKSLADLSERSQIDTCRALRSLLRRLTYFSNVPTRTPAENRGTATHRGKAKAASTGDHGSKLSCNKTRSSRSRPKLRGPTLAQVVIQNSNEPPQIAMVRPGQRRRRTRSKARPLSGALPMRTREQSSPQPACLAAFLEPRPVANTTSDIAKSQDKQSTADIGADRRERSRNDGNKALNASNSTPRLTHPETSPFAPRSHLSLVPEPLIAIQPALPPAVAVSASTSALLVPRQQRKPTPTYYSIATDNTKLGEIPLHKWRKPYDFDRMDVLNREAYRKGWQNQPDELQDSRKSKVGFWGMFKRRIG